METKDACIDHVGKKHKTAKHVGGSAVERDQDWVFMDTRNASLNTQMVAGLSFLDDVVGTHECHFGACRMTLRISSQAHPIQNSAHRSLPIPFIRCRITRCSWLPLGVSYPRRYFTCRFLRIETSPGLSAVPCFFGFSLEPELFNEALLPHEMRCDKKRA